MSDILVTGSSGYVAKSLLPLISKKYNCICIDRSTTEHLYQNNTYINEDINNFSYSSLKKIQEFSGKIIHLAAARSDNANKDEYFRDNIEATLSFLTILNPSNIEKFIHIGSVAAIDGESLLGTRYEDISDNHYRVTKCRQQVIIEKWCELNNIPLIILAPSAIYDDDANKHNTNVGRMTDIAKILPILPTLNIKKSLTPMSLIIDAIISNLEDGLTANRKYLVYALPVETVSEFLNKKYPEKRLVTIPFLQQIMYTLAFILKLIYLDRRIGLTKHRIRKLFRSTVYDNELQYDFWTH